MALISLRGIRLSFGAERLLDDVDLNIERGDRACLVGRNGAGKSSFLKILHGELPPDQGEIKAVDNPRIAYLAQDVPTDLSGTVDEITASWLRSESGSADTSTHRVGKILSYLGLDPESQFDELSGGQKRRVLLIWLLGPC